MSELPMETEKYREAIRRLRKLSEEMSAVRGSLHAVWGHVGDAWQGAASDAFLETGEWTTKDLERLRFEMEDLARDLEAALAWPEET